MGPRGSGGRRRADDADLDRIEAFHRGWWIMAAITAIALVPTLWLIRLPRAMARG